jgi:hypothetical protein
LKLVASPQPQQQNKSHNWVTLNLVSMFLCFAHTCWPLNSNPKWSIPMLKFVIHLIHMSSWLVSTNPWNPWKTSSLKATIRPTYNLWRSTWQSFIAITRSQINTLWSYTNFTKEFETSNVGIKQTKEFPH